MKTIVYIDDEPAICRGIADVLRDCGAQVRTFTDPKDAVAYINSTPPSLVICDYRMPGMDGFDVLERLEVAVPFALISGYLALDIEGRKGITAVLNKPLRPEDLLAFVEPFVAAPE